MTNKELHEKIARLEAELAEVKEMAEAMKKGADGGLFKPEDGQEYWIISGEGKVYRGQWENHPIDHDRYSIGNCFPTKQSAEDTVRVLKLIQKARETQDGFVPDWKDDEQDKCFLYFCNDGISVGDLLTMNLAPIFGVWKNESTCEQFIDENYEDLKWFFTEYRR